MKSCVQVRITLQEPSLIKNFILMKNCVKVRIILKETSLSKKFIFAIKNFKATGKVLKTIFVVQRNKDTMKFSLVCKIFDTRHCFTKLIALLEIIFNVPFF